MPPTSRLSGTVHDPNGRPVRSASVVLHPFGVGTVTGIAGEFTFQVPPGRFTLQIFAAGHHAQHTGPIEIARGVAHREVLVLEPRTPAPVVRHWREAFGHRASVR